MDKTYLLTNALLWAAAIIASTVLGAPTFLTLILLPSLGMISVLFGRERQRVVQS